MAQKTVTIPISEANEKPLADLLKQIVSSQTPVAGDALYKFALSAHKQRQNNKERQKVQKEAVRLMKEKGLM